MFRVIVYLTAFLTIFKIHCAVAFNCDAEQSSIEGRLQKQLFCTDYDKSQRPVEHHETATNVSISIYMKNYALYEYDPSLHISNWLSVSWKDEFLTWDRADYGIDMLNVDESEIWRPMITSYSKKQLNTIDRSCNDHKCELKHTGEVSCISPCTYEAHCTSTNIDWPFDVMDCRLYFSSWLQYKTELNMTGASNVSTSYVTQHHYSWKLLSAEKENSNHSDDDTYPSVVYVFKFERHMGLYTAILTPGFLLVVLSWLVLWLDYSSSERLYILYATCIGHFTFMEFLFWHQSHQTEDVPKMLLFYRDSLFINVFTVILTIILKYTNPKPHSPERLIDRWAFRVASTSLGRVLLLRGHFIGSKRTLLREENEESKEHYNHAGNGNGDTINLVIDRTNGNGSVDAETEKYLHDLKIMFIDRSMLLCCFVSYVIMIINLYPNKH